MATIKVRIVDPKHPHYPECGTLTGKMVEVLGVKMTEVALDNCQHGTGGCFVKAGQIAELQAKVTEG